MSSRQDADAEVGYCRPLRFCHNAQATTKPEITNTVQEMIASVTTRIPYQ